MSELGIRPKAPVGAAGERPLSVRERLRSAQQALADESTKEFLLPGYGKDNQKLGGGELVVRYKRMDFDPLEEVFRRERWVNAEGHYDVVAANAQFLADACEDMWVREPDGTITPLVEGHATTFSINVESGESLGTVMALESLPSLRDQIVAAFGGNEIALNDHSGDVHRWMVSANTADMEKALGEALAR